MKPIEHFMLPEHTNKLYTKEAISSMSLTRDVADKINELVDAYNSLAEIDLTWKHEQEGRIRKGVLFMKDNLLNSLHELLDLLGKSFIDERIVVNLGLIQKRLDNLLSTYTDGATTRDAEVIDGRVTIDGEIFDTLGNAIREQIIDIYETLRNQFIISVSGNLLNEAELIYGEYVDKDGYFYENASFCRTKIINITANNGHLCVLTYPENNPLTAGASFHRCAFYDIQKRFIGCINNGTTNGSVASGVVKVPENAVYFACSFRVVENEKYMIAFSNTTEINYVPYESFNFSPYEIYKTKTNRYFEGMKLLTIGDSITAQGLWQNYIVNALKFSTFYNHGYSGLQSWQIDTDANIETWESDANVILVMVGTNDWAMSNKLGEKTDTSNVGFSGSMYNFIKKLYTKYPTAHIVLLGCPYGMLPNKDGFSKNGRLNTLGLTTVDYSNRVKEICEMYGVPFIATHDIGINEFNVANFMQDDGGRLHPNEAGGKLLGQRVCGLLSSMFPLV